MTVEPSSEADSPSYSRIRARVDLWRLSGDGWLAQLTRFALVGGSSNALYALAFLFLTGHGYFVANTVGVTASTVLANELHRRLTFRAAGRVHWFAAQWEGGTLALLGLLLSSLVLALLHLFIPTATGIVQALLVIATSAAIGGLRFLALRGWVFAPADQPRDTVGRPEFVDQRA
ncbi:GtrA family protein [Rhodococcus marinonascens]|uniref:GtrA family protein n=1 Tax=Rhodococcus marinonascens TaxID=38311 RepID=UPI0009FE905C|nr:GtrA family protein [Rhodococcus marinonascens]